MAESVTSILLIGPPATATDRITAEPATIPKPVQRP